MLLFEVLRFQLKLSFLLSEVADDGSSFPGDRASFTLGDFVSLLVCARGPLTLVCL